MDKIILLNSSALSDSSQKKEDRLRAIKVLESGKKQFINEAIPKLLAEKNRKKLSKEIEAAKIIAQDTSNHGISAALLGMKEREGSLEWVKKTSTPVVYISGEEDGIIPILSCREQAEQSNSNLYTIKDCGHMAHVEKKQKCFTIIRICMS